MNREIVVSPFDAILVPRGQEYRAVCRGLRRLEGKLSNKTIDRPQIIAIPLGMKAVTEFFAARTIVDVCQKQQPKLLLLGLAGGLSPLHRVGDVVIYQDCLYATDDRNYQFQECDRNLTVLLQQNLGSKARSVRGLTSKYLVCTAAEKQLLASLYPASVVDMEGFSLLASLRLSGVSVAMIRVISDDYSQSIPNINLCFRENGSINYQLLAIAFIKQPFAAQRLIRNSLKSLSILERVTETIWNDC
jgi:nucleoside phosphorylase